MLSRAEKPFRGRKLFAASHKDKYSISQAFWNWLNGFPVGDQLIFLFQFLCAGEAVHRDDNSPGALSARFHLRKAVEVVTINQ